MTGAALVRVAALVAVCALFVTDYGMNLWVKEIGSSVYLFLLAIAFGVDAAWFREVLKAILTRTIGLEDKRP